MRLWITLTILLMLTVGCAPISAPPATSSDGTVSDGVVAFTNVRVFDGEEVIPTATVLVQDGSIAAVGTDVEIPDGAEVIDGTGQTLLPGLIDAHTHVFSVDSLRQALIFGVTTELDMFMDTSLAGQMRQEQAAGDVVDRASLFSAGVLATAPNGHGTQFGLPVTTLTTPQEAQAFVEARIAEGSDYIKIIIESGEEMGMAIPTLDQATVDALVEAAHAADKIALVHVQTLAAAQMALEAGSDGLAHIFVDAVPDDAFVEEAAASGLFVIPTFAVFQHIGSDPQADVPGIEVLEDPNLAPYLTTSDEQILSASYSGFVGLSLQSAQEAVRLLSEAGVPILAGTDAGNPGTTHGASIHRELELLTQAGLSPTEALAAATSVTADTFSLDDRGRIFPGLRADLLLVNGDPTTTITATRDIAGVWKLGVRVDREGYLAQLEAQRAAAAEQLEAFAERDMVAISDFEDGTLGAEFGAGWIVTTDQPAGGNSTAELEVVAEGAQGSEHALSVSGEVGDAVPFAWAGVSYYPSAQPFAPFDISSKPNLHFWAKGEGGPFRIQLFCTGVGQVPPEQRFEVTAEWQAVTVDLSTIEGCDLTGLQAIILSAGTAPGAFSLQIDDVSRQSARCRCSAMLNQTGR